VLEGIKGKVSRSGYEEWVAVAWGVWNYHGNFGDTWEDINE
jgi:hypothetical protein